VALHLTRLGHRTAYLTALGCDPFAGRMRHDWAREGLDVSLVLSHPDRTTGLYAIETDAKGERRFSYWRSQSAARALFECDGIAEAEAEACNADLLSFSLISLAILPADGRERLLGLARDVRAGGGMVAFDSNFRARLWESEAAARAWCDKAIALADIGLPTREDEFALGTANSAQAIADYWRERGAGEVLVKLGVEGCLLPDGGILP